MVVSVAFTSPIPSSLTKDQVWKGLVLKSRDARGFLDAIETCTVISERPNGVTRLGKFKNTDPVHEVITYFPPYTMEFAAQETGSRVYNTISEGADEQLFLTFVFLFRHPSATEGSMEEREKAAPVLNGGAGAVVGTLRRIEELVKEGKI